MTKIVLGHFDTFWGKKWICRPLDSVFVIKWMSKKNSAHFKIFYFGFQALLNTFLIKKWIFTPLVCTNFLHKMNVQKNFQLRITILSKNDCSTTWCPNCYNKKTTYGKLRNDHRHEKHVVIFRPTLLTVADMFKPTVSFTSNFKFLKENNF